MKKERKDKDFIKAAYFEGGRTAMDAYVKKEMTFKVPEDGMIKSKFSHQVNIHFRLPGSPAVLPATKKINPAPQGLQVQYQVTTTPAAPKKQPASKSSSYQFTIQLPNSNKIKE